MSEYNAEIYKKAFEIAVRCARELNGTPELKEAYQAAQKDNRALRLFMDFCLQKATEELPEKNAVEIVPVVRCKDCKHSEPCGESRQCLHPYGLNTCDGKDFCSYGERRTDGKELYKLPTFF